MKKSFAIIAAVALLSGFSSQAAALPISINDPGVVGLLEGQTANDVTVEAQIANNILSLGESVTVLASVFASPAVGDINCNGGQNDQRPCHYMTGDNAYSGTVTGGVKQDTNPTVLLPQALLSAYILVKFDGPNAGYVLFNTADWLAAGNTTLPATGDGLANWGAQGSGNSHYTYFGSRTVPDGGMSLLLLGAALGGLGILRRRMNV